MRTFGVLTSFVSSPETEKERLLYSCAIVASGFYKRHGLLVLPKAAKGYERYCEVLPEVVKNFSQKFWQDAARGGALMPKAISKRMHQEAKGINLSPVSSDVIQKFKSSWEKIEKPAWQAIRKFFPSEYRWIGSLEIRLTKIGSIGSHYLLSQKRGQPLIIYLRKDADYKSIINLLLLSLIYPLEKELELSFTKRQAVRNFILTRPEFRKIYSGFKPSVFDNPKIPAFLKKKSAEYIRSLGIPGIINPIDLINSNLDKFGIKEEKILKLLIKNKGTLVTYDMIADEIWGVGEFKSYWAINKIVQRIRAKAGSLQAELDLKGVRGKGYILSDF